MSYQVLARKWRPRRFDTLVGQQHVVQALSNALTQQRLHHAYLFTGTRGVGKTTIARIIAKCLNCETGITAEPCDQCQSCQEIDAGRFVDLIEVDAASRTKVEDTRELLDNVQYAPTKGRYKVFLIDEVHMLSGHSFNALLKTLEEPPEHVKFILATTDPQKLPATVLSRCLQFHLRNLTVEQIAGHLANVLTQENIHFDPEALQRLGRAAHGSIRDSLSLLDQAISFGDGHVTTASVKDMLGSIESHHLHNIVNALIANNGQQLLQIVTELAELGADFSNVAEELLSFLHQINVLQAVPDAKSSLWDEPDAARELAKQLTAEEAQLYYQIALTGRRDLPLAPTPRSGFEILLLRMLAFRPAALANESTNVTPAAKQSPPLTANPTGRPAAKSAAQPTTQPVKPTSPQTTNTEWGEILVHLQLSGPTQAIAAHCSLIEQTSDKVTLALSPKHAPLYNERHRQRINDAINKYFSKNLQLVVNIEEYDIMTPAKQQEKQQQQQKAAAVNTVQQNDTVQAIVNAFDATIVTNSISVTDEER